MDMHELVLKTRSYRGFDESVKITREQLLKLVDLARLSASSQNKQPLRYFLSYTPEQNAVIQPLTGWARRLPDLKLPREGHRPTAFIVVLIDKTFGDPVAFKRDVGIVSQSIMLGATEMGLSGCMIGNFSAEKVSAALDLPENLHPELILALGKGDETIKIVPLKEGEKFDYYRDENDVHYVPKRALEDIVLN
ncbi:MAG: nitroreductase family protein [Clostridia bacterium]|nr:nitroreductase family protein [Clostridia bacterium]